jgi:hypothetical protein
MGVWRQSRDGLERSLQRPASAPVDREPSPFKSPPVAPATLGLFKCEPQSRAVSSLGRMERVDLDPA